MKNTTTEAFIAAHQPCAEGAAFAAGYPTMYDCYEALLRGDAGFVRGFEWALWVRSAIAADIEPLVQWALEQVRPLVPEEVQKISYEDLCGAEKLRADIYKRLMIQNRKIGEPGEPFDRQTPEDKVKKLALAVYIGVCDCFFMDYLVKRGAAPERQTAPGRYVYGEWSSTDEGEGLPQGPTDTFMARLQALGNPFNKEIEE